MIPRKRDEVVIIAFRSFAGLTSFRGDAQHRTRNLEIPRCAIAHLRSGAYAPSRNDDDSYPASANRGARLSMLARTASSWLGAPISFICSTDSASSAGPGSTDRLLSMRLQARIASG